MTGACQNKEGGAVLLRLQIALWRSSVRQQGAPSLKDRASSRGTSSFRDATTTRGEGYKEWDKQSMVHAVKVVIEEGMSIRKAALRYNIPRSTLGDHVSGQES